MGCMAICLHCNHNVEFPEHDCPAKPALGGGAGMSNLTPMTDEEIADLAFQAEVWGGIAGTWEFVALRLVSRIRADAATIARLRVVAEAARALPWPCSHGHSSAWSCGNAQRALATALAALDAATAGDEL